MGAEGFLSPPSCGRGTSLLKQAASGMAGESPPSPPHPRALAPPQGSCPTVSSQRHSVFLQVDKLRLLLLEKEDENLLLSDKYQDQVRGALRL